MIPGLHPEKCSHLRNAPADHRGGKPEVFQAEGKFVPHGVGDNLRFRILQNDAHGLRREAVPGRVGLSGRRSIFRAVCRRILRGAGRRPNRRHVRAVHENPPRKVAEGREFALDEAEKGGFAAAGEAAKHCKITRIHGKTDPAERVIGSLRIAEGYIFDR